MSGHGRQQPAGSRQTISNGVIVADNDVLMRSVIRSVLQRAELQVFPVANGIEAVGLARQFVARLVLLDVAMPLLNGLLACKAIHGLPGYADVPIIMLTGYGDDRVREAARQCGATDFVTKPFAPDILLTRLALHIDVPAPLLRAITTAGSAATARRQIWAPQPDPARAGGPAADLIRGQETMRIFRSMDRRG